MDFVYNPFVIVGLGILAFAIGAAVKMAYFNKPKAEEDKNGLQLNVGVVAVALALAVLFQLPSLSIDVNGIFTYAFDVVNAFMPLIAIIAGLGLGFNLIGKISSLFNRAL